jgi:hypothetical protein
MAGERWTPVLVGFLISAALIYAAAFFISHKSPGEPAAGAGAPARQTR